MPSLSQSYSAVQQARAWAAAAPRYTGDHRFGEGPGRPLVFGVFGDSLGCGLGATAVDRSLAGLMAGRMAETRPVLCRIRAVSGAQAPDLAAQAVDGDEAVAVVSIGTNDLLSGSSFWRMRSALKAFLAGLRHAERVVVVGPGDVAALELFPAAARPLLRLRVLSCEQALTETAAEFPNACHLGPSSLGLTLGPSDFAADGFHPGDAGQALIAGAVLRCLD